MNENVTSESDAGDEAQAARRDRPAMASFLRTEAPTPGPSHLVYQGRLHGALARRLGIDILRGVFKQGETLPNEIDSSSSLDISRSAYREAIRILAAKGMVESRPKTGTRVTDRARWNLLDPEVLGWMFETEPDPDFIKALFELRLITEPAAAELAAMRRTDAQVQSMRRSLDIMKRETLQTEAGRRADLEFHHALIQATDNEALASLSSSIEAAVSWTTRYKARHNALTRDPVPDHERVFEAIAAGDAKAARWCMESLIRMAHDDTQRAFSN